MGKGYSSWSSKYSFGVPKAGTWGLLQPLPVYTPALSSVLEKPGNAQ